MGTLIGLGIFAAVVLFGAWRMYKLRKAMNDPMRDDVCVACGSKLITTTGEGLYTCNDCGYEGGSGQKKKQEQDRQEAVARMTPEQRRAGGIKDMKEARTLLISSQGTLKDARSQSRMDMAGLGRSGDAKQNALMRAVGDLIEAQNHILSASLKLDVLIYEQKLNIDFTSASFFLDVSFDNIFSDFMVHGKIKEAMKYSQTMLAAVEESLTTLNAS